MIAFLLIYMSCTSCRHEIVFYYLQNNFRYTTCTKNVNQKRIDLAIEKKCDTNALKFLSDSMEEGGINWIINILIKVEGINVAFFWLYISICSLLYLDLMLFFVEIIFPICPLRFKLNGPIMTIIYLRGQLYL